MSSEKQAVREGAPVFTTRESIVAAFAAVEWVGMDTPDQLHRSDVFATDEGVLRLPDAPPLRVYRLNTGKYAFLADDVIDAASSESESHA